MNIFKQNPRNRRPFSVLLFFLFCFALHTNNYANLASENSLINTTINTTATLAETKVDFELKKADEEYIKNRSTKKTPTITPPPCANPIGIDSDGDGIDNACDLDDDNDGILDTQECMNASTLVTNGNFSTWIFASGWSGSGTNWNITRNRASFNRWNGGGTGSFYQNINVIPNKVNTVMFDVGSNSRFPIETTLTVKINGVTHIIETSTQIVTNNGGNASNNSSTKNMDVRSFSFTPTTNFVTLSFEATALSNNHDVIYIDNVLTTSDCVDTDEDSVPNYLDLDSDNDGIYDAEEAGHGVAHTNGRLTGPIGNDGVPNSVQSSGQNNSGLVNYIPLDTDWDTIQDFVDLDSDNDGCNDVVEAGFTENSILYDELQGTSYDLTTGIVTGNIDGYTTPTDNDSDSMFDYRVSGGSVNITTEPSDINTASGNNVTFQVIHTGTAQSYQWQKSTDGGMVFQDMIGETSATLTINGVSITDDGTLYMIIIIDTSFICDPIYSEVVELSVVLDTDNDGVEDTVDLDDDNDGILDEDEANNCSATASSVDVVIFNEDFGVATGSRMYTSYTNYPYENGYGSAGINADLQDGEYTIFEDISATGSWAPSVWQSAGDHTSGIDRMMIVNSDNTSGLEFYRRSLVQVTANVPLNISFWVMNLDIDIPSNAGRTEPNITAYVQQAGITVHSFTTGNIARETDGDQTNAWKEFSGTFTPTTSSSLELVLINSAPGGGGNDLALDDIQVTQAFCDSDGDGIPNNLQADSDGDGCYDSDEAYGNGDTDLDNNGKYGSGSPAVNADGTVIAASYATPVDQNSNGILDFIEVGNAPSITTQPSTTITSSLGGNFAITVAATDASSYQWQYFNGTAWVNLTNSGIYTGTTTNTLVVTRVTHTENGYSYRVVVSNSTYVCHEEISSIAVLTVRVRTIITNRRITYRVNKS